MRVTQDRTQADAVRERLRKLIRPVGTIRPEQVAIDLDVAVYTVNRFLDGKTAGHPFTVRAYREWVEAHEPKQAQG